MPISAIAFVAAALAAHMVLVDPSLIDEGVPEFGFAFTVSMLVTAACSAAFVYRVAQADPTGPVRRDVFRTHGLLAAFERLAVLAVLLGCIAILAVFGLQPETFSRWAAEDYVIEMLSAVLCFAGGAIFLACGAALWRRGRDSGNGSLLQTAFFFCAAFASILIGFEEISWFQRQLSFDTPDAFAANTQDEMNLHNFATNAVENVYYFASFLFFVLIPFLHAHTRWFDAEALRDLVPGLGPFFVTAISCGYVYDMWTGFPSQLAFWLAAFVSMSFALRAGSKTARAILWTCFALLVVSQLAFLLRGDLQRDRWDVTEYREYLIAIGIFLYACEQWLKRSRFTALEAARA